VHSAITEYAAHSEGNVAPIAVITGHSTLLASPISIALDSSDDILVANIRSFLPDVAKFDAGSVGNVAPVAVIAGSNTQLSHSLLRIAIKALLKPTPVPSPSTIRVNTLLDESTGGDGLCSLREAIQNANTNSDTTGGDCDSGSGDDIIRFTISGTVMLTASLPTIRGSVTIDGSGQDITVSGANAFRVFVVRGSAVKFTNITVANGLARGGNAAGDFPGGGAAGLGAGLFWLPAT
jgi:CSLREA domain-containing protein